MRFIKHSVIAAITAFLAAATPVLAEGKTEMTTDQKDVLALIRTMTGSFEKGDIDAVMQTYEPNQSIAFEPGVPVSDSAVSRTIFEQFHALSPEFSYSGHEVIVEGDIAVHVAPWRMTGTDPEGNRISDSGLSIAVLRRQADGGWKMVIDNPHGSRLLAPAN